jgi:F-type H+-transporting ATPase subunit b
VTLSWQLVLFEVFNFCLLMAILGRFLYRPVREALRQRREQLEQARREVEAREQEAERARTEFDARRAELEQEADALRSSGRKRGEQEAEHLISEARDAMLRDRERFEDDLAQTERRALGDLRQQVLLLAVEAASRVVGSMELPDIATAYARLGGRRLKEQLGEVDGERLHVAVSPDAEPATVRAALEDVLGACDLELTTNTDLVGGVRLHLRDLEVEASAGATLKAWLEGAQRSEAQTSGPAR